MFRPHLIKRIKPVNVKEPIKQINSSTWIKASEDVCCGENIREMGATSTSITDLPFPAITICNVNKARNSVATKFTPGSSQSIWLQNICYDEYENITFAEGDAQKESRDWQTFKQYLLNISQPCSKMLLQCRYALETFQCMEVFDTVLSDEVVPEFLYMNPSNASSNFEDDVIDQAIPVDWTPEKGYADLNIKKKATPRPSAGPGSHLGLYVMLNGDVSDYFCSSTSSAGFKILLHNPTETPRISDFGMTCGCVIYYMPRINLDAKICNRVNSKCYNAVRISMERGDNIKYKCNCLPGCDELSFLGEISGSPLTTTHFQTTNQLINFSAEVIKRDIAIVQVFYADSLFRSYVKDELIGFTEFLSNTGGLLGLFMGFSAVSLVEMLYFISLRLYCRRYYGGRGSKHLSKRVDTISRLISKNHRHIWPFVWTHSQNMDRIKNNNNSMLSAYDYSRRYHHRGVQVNSGWKAPTETAVYPYLD
ncbi:pickpocket protein 28-like [Sitodiplosis mosellana]|uniref:pickpocket protein 28-like n=1 Tax=Sitodiplosis mosellana TaxID=263140 RepID=UPI002444D195|nr:pickpocket protein 28-like [Sitodiplosis mosellana]